MSIYLKQWINILKLIFIINKMYEMNAIENKPISKYDYR